MFTKTPPYYLTNRELEILKMIANGKQIDSISTNLNISSSTVKNHKTNILRKMNATTSSEAVFKACKIGIL